MGFFDRFKSQKGKAAAKPKGPGSAKGKTADETKQELFAAVSSSQGGSKTPAADSKKPEEAKKQASAPALKESTGQAYRLLLRPVVTEKSSMVKGKYSFEVPLTASKMEVRQAVLHAYGIQPIDVTMLRRGGKYVRYGRATGRTIDRKQAVVTLPPGKTIEVFSA